MKGDALLSGAFILNCNVDVGFSIQNKAKIIYLESSEFPGAITSYIMPSNNYKLVVTVTIIQERQEHSGNPEQPCYWLETREYYDRW